MNRWFLLFLVIFSTILLFLSFNYRKVELDYGGSVIITPPISYYRGNSHYSFFVRSGKSLKDYLENNLFPEAIEIDGETLNGKPFIRPEKYNLRWDNNIEIKDDEVYYVALGCEIEKISYFYHTKFTNYLNDPSVFINHSTNLKPINDKGIINIYRGDVAVVE